MKTIVNSANLFCPPSVTLVEEKVVLVGGNGAGKSSLLHAISLYHTGKPLKGLAVKDVTRTAWKVDIVGEDGRPVAKREVIDLGLLYTMSGPARAQAIFSMLGATITTSDILHALALHVPENRRSLLPPPGLTGSIDACLTHYGNCKKDSERWLDGHKLDPKMDASCTPEAAKAEIAAINAKLDAHRADPRPRLSRELGEVVAKLSGHLSKSAQELQSLLSMCKREANDLAEQHESRSRDALAAEVQANNLSAGLQVKDRCPMCGQKLPHDEEAIARRRTQHEAAQRTATKYARRPTSSRRT